MNRQKKPLINRGLFLPVVNERLSDPWEPEVFRFPGPTLLYLDVIIDLTLKSGDLSSGIFSDLEKNYTSYCAKTN